MAEPRCRERKVFRNLVAKNNGLAGEIMTPGFTPSMLSLHYRRSGDHYNHYCGQRSENVGK